MKRIVNIPDRTYDFIMGLNQYTFGSKYAYKEVQSDIVKAVKESKPYNESGDCVSRSALIEESQTLCEDCTIKTMKPELCKSCFVADFLKLIHNAPTVETYTDTDLIEENKKGFATARRLYERPQGEWNEIQAGLLVCPFCGANPHKVYKNFCPKCGADMGGNAE